MVVGREGVDGWEVGGGKKYGVMVWVCGGFFVVGGMEWEGCAGRGSCVELHMPMPSVVGRWWVLWAFIVRTLSGVIGRAPFCARV